MDGRDDLSNDARRLWDAALSLNTLALARPGPAVSDLARRSPPSHLPPLLFLTDPERTPRPWETVARLPCGAAVVHRHFGAPDARATAERLRATTTQRGVLLLIGLDADLAEIVGADGLHLPERGLANAKAVRARHPDWVITGTVHSLEAAVRAPVGLDAVVLSPIFAAGGASASKAALGVETLKAAVQSTACPVYALGGVSLDTLGQLAGTGVCGLAGVEAIQSAFAAPSDL